ncbi:hypothetical protein [Clostridium hydrogenum]|uniref:hypothetical protein n=1 Tax=Clostridium hydrogenum TaxID=2855764 RepID=UPI001F182821|nr:hypothetical protein [Clostridium hydrogenum]
MQRKKKLNLELEESLNCKDDILNEFKQIRHEYNNILQNIICLMEQENFTELKKYKESVISKTHLLNQNSITQLVKIKNKNILNLIYKILINAKQSNVTINLMIYNNIDEAICSLKKYKILNSYISFAYETAVKNGTSVQLKVNSSKQGLRFVFETELLNPVLKPIQIKKPNRKCKDIYYNFFSNECKLEQEILMIITK